MASFECKGLDRLIKKIDDIAKVPEELKDEIIEDVAEEVLKQQKKDAPANTGKGKEALDIIDIRSGEGYTFIDIGIGAENWEQCKGLWFQNFDGERSSGRYVLWMENSFKSIEKSIKEDIKNRLIKEMDL